MESSGSEAHCKAPSLRSMTLNSSTRDHTEPPPLPPSSFPALRPGVLRPRRLTLTTLAARSVLVIISMIRSSAISIITRSHVPLTCNRYPPRAPQIHSLASDLITRIQSRYVKMGRNDEMLNLGTGGYRFPYDIVDREQ